MNEIEEMIFPTEISEEIEQSFLDYSVSVITDRALPDVKDGLKTVHKRILFAMNELKLSSSKPHKKSAQVVGFTLGRLHPHGDASVYEAMVRLAQDFIMNIPLVDGHGNFGNIDGDRQASARYTEARLSKAGEAMLLDLNKNTVDWKSNYSEESLEPVALPSRIPNLLVNPITGIAVGLACSFAPMNLGKTIKAIKEYVKNNDITVKEIMDILVCPDFPTGGIIINQNELVDTYTTGRGKIRIRGEYREEKINNHNAIVFYSIPYLVKKADLVAELADLVENKEIQGIADIRDESAQDIRIVIELKKGVDSEQVINDIFVLSQLESTFPVNNTCLVDGQPRTLSIKEMIKYYVEFQQEVILRRSKFDYDEAHKRKLIVLGYLVAQKNIDEVIDIIRNSENKEKASQTLIDKFNLQEEQVKSILAMRLSSLTNLEVDNLKKELEQLEKKEKELNKIINSPQEINKVFISELEEISKPFITPMKTSATNIAKSEVMHRNQVVAEKVNIAINHDTICTFLSDKEIKSASNLWHIWHILQTDTSQSIIVFTSDGLVHKIKVSDIIKGCSLYNILQLNTTVKIINILPAEDSKYVVFLTQQGKIKKTVIEEYLHFNKSNIVGIKLAGEDAVVSVLPMNEEDITILSEKGKTITFATEDISAVGRNTQGVNGINLEKDDKAVDFCILKPEDKYHIILTKDNLKLKAPLDEFSKQNRNGKGLKGITLNANDKAIAIYSCTDNEKISLEKEVINSSDLKTTARGGKGKK